MSTNPETKHITTTMAQMHDLRPEAELEQIIRSNHPGVRDEERLTTEYVYQGRLRKALFIVLDDIPGAAYSCTETGVI